jgi:hypothetical protein
MRAARVVLFGCVLLLAGCAGSPAAGPVSGPAAAAAPSPLDIGAFQARPCDLIKPGVAQRADLTSPGRPQTGPAGPTCHWDPADPGHPAATASVDAIHGLDTRPHPSGFTEPGTVDGYPAVHTAPTPAPDHGTCTVTVQTAPGQTLTLTAGYDDPHAPGYDDPCTAADSLATRVIGNLRSGNP